MTATRGFGRSAIAQRRSTIACSSGACSGVTTFARDAASAILSEVKYWRNASPPIRTSANQSWNWKIWSITTKNAT